MHDFSVHFQASRGPKPGFSHFAEYLKKENSLRSLNAVFNNMGLINKVDIVCLSPVGYGV